MRRDALKRSPYRRILASVSWGIGLTSLLWPTMAAAGEAQELELATSRLDRGDYAGALERLNVMLDPLVPLCGSAMENSGHCRLGDPSLVQVARSQSVIALIALERFGDADAQILALFRENPTFVPNPAVFPQAVLDRMARVRGENQTELDALALVRAERDRVSMSERAAARERQLQWQSEVERLASQRLLVERRSRWIAAIPFGVGQFQNGHVAAGVAFASAEVLAVTSTIVTSALAQQRAAVDITRVDAATGRSPDPVALSDELALLTTLNHVSFGALLVLVAAGIVDSQMRFASDVVHVESRPLPPRPALGPQIGAGPQGAMVGLSGRF